MLSDFFDNLNLLGSLDETRRFPFTDIAYDKDKTIYVTIALAGYNKENVKVSYSDCELTIEAVDNNEPTSELTYIQRHISNDKVTRTISFNYMYKDADVSAVMDNGLLKVTVKPKLQQNTSKYIKIL